MEISPDIKLLFLDFDGVLNDKSWAHWANYVNKASHIVHINPFLVANLIHVLHECPDVRIVVSSSWRHRHDLLELSYLLSGFGVPAERVIGATSRKDDNPRGERILEWLTDHKCQDNFFLIVDDDEDMAYFWPHLFHTDADVGFTAIQADQMIQAFNEKTLPFMPSAADRKYYWETRKMLYDKMGIDEAAAWFGRRNPEFGNVSPSRWVRTRIEVASDGAWALVHGVTKEEPHDWVKSRVEKAAQEAWEVVQNAVRKIP